MGKRYRWLVLSIFMSFVIFHYADKLMISFLTPSIMNEFEISYTEMGMVLTGSLIVASILYPTWGYLYDKYSRTKLISLASFIWGATTWISALARNFFNFLISRSATGVDDSCYPGIYSVVSDYFKPAERGRAMGLLYASNVTGTILGSLISLFIGSQYGWRYAYFFTGSIGIIIALMIYLFVRDPQRGISEPELESFSKITVYRISRENIINVLRKRTLLLLYIQCFSAMFAWQAIIYWMFSYLVNVRNYPNDEATFFMIILMVLMTIGYIVGGVFGDFLFKKYRRGRLLFSTLIVFASAILITLTIYAGSKDIFQYFAIITASVIPMASANVIATINDVTEPEARSLAISIHEFFGNVGSSLSPLAAGIIADVYGLGVAIASISSTAWLFCGIFLFIASLFVVKDMDKLRNLMRERAMLERKKLETDE
ncbi:MAG: MFS transporter [Nitrososphaeria archaeon]|nr:MFS transporter [Nitrososphaeria archaeon]